MRRSRDSFGVGSPKWVLLQGTLGGQQGRGVPGRSEGLRLGRVDGAIKENERRAHQTDKGICGPTQLRAVGAGLGTAGLSLAREQKSQPSFTGLGALRSLWGEEGRLVLRGAGSWQARTPLRTGVWLLLLTLPSSYSLQPPAGGSPKPSPASQSLLLPLLISGQFSILTAPQECACRPRLGPCCALCLGPLGYPPTRPHILFPTGALLTAMPPCLCCLQLALRRFACPSPACCCLPP